MKELNIEDKAKRYDEAIEIARKINDGECVLALPNWTTYEVIFPELKESEDERIRKELLAWLKSKEGQTLPMDRYNVAVAWLEKQGEYLENYDEAEKEKIDFVGDGFIECHADFLDFKEGNTYWLEYIGDDKYNVRSDNLLGKTYHITPCQLYTIFKKLTWLEKQGEQTNVLAWKHWKDGITGNGEGNFAYLIKNGDTYSLSSCLGHECDYIELYELNKMLSGEKQGEQEQFDYENANIQPKDSAPIEPKFKVKPIRDGLKTEFQKQVSHLIASTINNEYDYTRGHVEWVSQSLLGYAKNELKLVECTEKDEPKSAWSEDDERICQCLIKDQEEALDKVSNSKYGHSEIIADLEEIYHERIDWLKSLKERYTWKPSDEQINALNDVISSRDIKYDVLSELWKDLKKLREE